MAKGGPGQQKGGERECKVCSHVGRKQIEVQILNGVPYATIIAQAARDFPTAAKLTKPNLTNHKNNHLLNNPITVVDEEGEKQTYLTGHYKSQSIEIPPEAVPIIPNVTDALKIIIAAGLHNVLNNPALVSPDKLITALIEYRKIGGNGDELDKFLGSWGEVAARKGQLTKAAKRTKRILTVEEETIEPADEPAKEVIEGEWSEAELNNLALPPPGATSE